MPEGLDLTDVHGEGWSTAVIEAESDPAWLIAILLFIKAHWAVILVSGLVLRAISRVRIGGRLYGIYYPCRLA